jgi:6-phosphogluconolactonase/glucosamine-6-phosphate isomerase/deaminase
MLQKFQNLKELNEHTVALFIQIANESISAKNRFSVALTGGSSPKD